MRKPHKHGNIRVIALIILYDNSNSLVFKLLGVVVYCFIDKYVRVDYFSLQIDAKLLSLHRGLEDTSFNHLSGIGIPETYIKHCSVLWLYSRQKFNTDIDLQKKIGVILVIKRFF